MAHRHGSAIPKILLAILMLSGATAAWALKAPAPDATRPGPYAHELQQRAPQLWADENGFLDLATGAYATLVNLKAGPYAGTSEQVARDFLAERAGMLALQRGSGDLRLDAVQQTLGGDHVCFTQTVGDVPVYRADVIVSLDASGAYVEAVANNYDPEVDRAGLSTVPAIGQAAAREIAIAALNIKGEPQFIGDVSEGLWIVRDEDVAGSTPRLAWRVVVPVAQPLGDWEIFVDARSGQVIRIADQAKYADGIGGTFDPDPLTTAEVSYGGQYVDNNDADSPVLTAEVVTHTLRDITFNGSIYSLSGPWITLLDFEPPVSPPATSPTPDGFQFTRAAQGFEDANVYFHIDQNQRYIQSLGFNNIQHNSIQCDPHGLNGDDNSHYIPSSNRIAWGEGGVDDAEDADVLLHEYGHAIQQSSRPGWGGGQQASMGEGFGDYWAGSYSASISSFRDFWVFNWDGHNPFWGGRVLNGTMPYSSWGSNIYTNGTSWASCLWLMRAEMGRSALDTDVLKHHFYQGTSATAAQAAAYLMQADQALYQGLHAGTIEYYFVLRGFLQASQFDVPELTHIPLPDSVQTIGPFPVTVVVSSISAITGGSVKVKYGTGGVFNHEVVLAPTGNPNEWGGEIPVQEPNTTFNYYLIADNTAGWRGASPRGAEYRHYLVHVGVDMADAQSEVHAALSFRLLGANPVATTASLHFNLPQPGAVRLALLDASGRVVRTLVDGALTAGPHAASWNTRDDAGRPLPSGLYFARLETDRQSLLQRLVVVR